MEISIQLNNTLKPSFTSKLNPVPAFTMPTTHGVLKISEISPVNEISHRFLKRISKFFLKNFAEKSKIKFYLDYKNGNKQKRKKILKYMEAYLRDIFEDTTYDDNITLLVAKDKHNKIQGACLSTSCREVPGCFDTTLWIDALAVNKKYRREGIANTLLKNLIASCRNSYTDVFLTGSNFASGFYEKFGFEKLDSSKKYQRTIINYLKDIIQKDFEYVKPYTLTLQPDKPRWYIKAANATKQVMDC